MHLFFEVVHVATDLIVTIAVSVEGILIILVVLTVFARKCRAGSTNDKAITNTDLPGENGTSPLAEAPPVLIYDCFITHNWGIDEAGRTNHETVSKINRALKQRGLNTWFDDDRMEGFILDQMTKEAVFGK